MYVTSEKEIYNRFMEDKSTERFGTWESISGKFTLSLCFFSKQLLMDPVKTDC